jgi:putative addiction module component (TIGR02574 family)
MRAKEASAMTQAVAEILSRLDSLSQAERAEVALGFLRSLEPEEEGAEQAWHAELARRVADIRSGKAAGKPSEQLFAELREAPATGQ